jgi:type II secretory pathway pseudopilin PulG
VKVKTTEDRAIALPRLAALLAVILVLALAVPYGAVRAMHERRLRNADHATQAIASALQAAMAARAVVIPAGTEMLAGPGDRGAVMDDRWKSATSIPLARVLPDEEAAAHPDPWGNAYLVNIAALRAGGHVWVLSAGPDGIVQTPFAGATGVQGDDRATRLR